MIRHGYELEHVEHPAILGKAAILASQVPACRVQAYTLRAVSLHAFQGLEACHGKLCIREYLGNAECNQFEGSCLLFCWLAFVLSVTLIATKYQLRVHSLHLIWQGRSSLPYIKSV